MSTGRYETLMSLRSAIFGDILLCRDWVTSERVVVKTVNLQLALQQLSKSQELVQENVLHEVEVLKRVRALGGHPNVINMHSYYVAKGGSVLHMVLDYCEGGDLLDACVQPSVKRIGDVMCRSSSGDRQNQEDDSGVEGRHEQRPEQELQRAGSLLTGVDGSKRVQEHVAHKYLADVLSGLRFLHHHGIAHRDISLENILLHHGRAVLADFGLSVSSAPSREFYCEEMVGKNYYMAPEIVAGERYDPRRADIWATGIAFFILLTSSPPFERADPVDSGFRFVAKRGIKAVFTAWGMDQDVSELMQDLLSRMLCVDPDERATMEEIWQHPMLHRSRDY